ncbi:MAG: hypothetical protein HY918_03350 [Candidatus Doudnabacteria bacterium]|nr:hypothetical protein [Candidatus Doudnabacteria bacterium]
MTKNNNNPIDKKLDKALDFLEQLIAIQLYAAGATQPEISSNLGIALGKVNRLVKGVKSPKGN